MTKTKLIAFTALFCAISVLLNSTFLSFTLTASQKVSFTLAWSFLAGVALGPWCGFAVGFLGDLLGSLVFGEGGAYLPLIGIGAGLAGMIPGILFRIRRGNVYVKAAISLVLVFVICTAGFNSLGIYLAFIRGKNTFFAWMIARLPLQAAVTGINFAVEILLSLLLARVKTPLQDAFRPFLKKGDPAEKSE